jgi:hypothetical protein
MLREFTVIKCEILGKRFEMCVRILWDRQKKHHHLRLDGVTQHMNTQFDTNTFINIVYSNTDIKHITENFDILHLTLL